MRLLPPTPLPAVLGVLAALVGGTAAAQTVQYRSPAGVTYSSLPDTGEVATAEAALAADPGNVDLILALGLAQAGRQQYREAIATFTRGIALAPDNAVLYRWRGHRYLSVRELDSARADLEHGLRLDPRCYGCLYHLGIVQYATGDFDGAAAVFARALPLAPDPGERAGSIDWSWMSLSRAGRADEAQAMVMAHADSLPPGYAYTRRLALYRGEIEPERIVTPADTGTTDLATLSYGIGNWYLVRGDTARAREWFGRAVQSGGWPAFGFIAAEAELRRLR
jgi:tetratricopeptide (TPR) repeat protein